MGRGGHAVHVLHLGGISEHGGRNLGGGEAVHLGAADAVVRGLCANRRDGEGTECCGNRRGWGLAWVLVLVPDLPRFHGIRLAWHVLLHDQPGTLL